MCCLFFMTTNSTLKIYFLELHMEILMQQLLHTQTKNYVVGQVSLYLKFISLKTGSWL